MNIQKLMNFESEYNVIVEEFKGINVDVENLQSDIDISEEGLKRFFLSLGDIFARIKNNAFTALTKKYRTELKTFIDQQPLQIEACGKIPSVKIFDLKIDYPTGAKGKYVDMIKQLDSCYNGANVKVVLSYAKDEISQLANLYLRENLSAEKACKKFNLILNDHANALADRFKKADKVFTSKGEGSKKAKFKDLFSYVSELNECKDSILDLGSYVEEVPDIDKTVSEIIVNVSQISEFVEKVMEGSSDGSMPSKEFILGLANSAKTLSRIIELYSLNVTRHLAVEHNLVLVYRKVLTQV